MNAYKTVGISENRDKPRVYLQGQFPARAGFLPGVKYDRVKKDDYLFLRISEHGQYIVSKKMSSGKEVPVIDINSRDALDIFEGLSTLRVVLKENEIWVMPTATEKRVQARTQRLLERLDADEPLKVGALAYGGGILDHAIHQGLASEGVDTQLAFANEIREDLLEHASEHNETFLKDTVALIAPLQEIAFDKRAMKMVPRTDILTAGLPCSGASISGTSKLKLKVPEDHPLVGHLVAGALAFIAEVNPAVFVLENVPRYATTGSAGILRNQLRDWGYDVHEREMLGTDFGDLEKRKRWCMVAVTRGIEFDFDAMMPELFEVRQLSSIMEKPEDVADRWSEMPGLRAKEERDKEAGKGFAMQLYTGEETSINTLTKGMQRNRSTDPKIVNASNPKLLRIPTAREHARIKGVPEHLIEGLSQTTAHELLGQGICVSPFIQVGKHLAKALLRFRDKARAGVENTLNAVAAAPKLKVAG